MSVVHSDFDLEDLIHVEQAFFDVGYTDGHAHGRIHGLIEGRALGREKGYELWEEIGFYEGFAKVWEAVCRKDAKKDDAAETRTETHIRLLLDLVSQFPRRNPSSQSNSSNTLDDSQLDVAALLNKIRSRYKTLCASLGVKPRLRTASLAAGTVEDISDIPRNETKKKVWKLGEKQSPVGSAEMSF